MKSFTFFHDDSPPANKVGFGSKIPPPRHTSRAGMLGCARKEAQKPHQVKLREQLAFMARHPHHLGVRQTVHNEEGWGMTSLYVIFHSDESAVEWILRFDGK